MLSVGVIVLSLVSVALASWHDVTPDLVSSYSITQDDLTITVTVPFAKPTPPTSTTSTAAMARPQVFGWVYGKDGKPVVGATVRVVYNALDPGHVPGDSNLIGSAVADGQGHCQVPTRSLLLGSIGDVSVMASGYLSAFMFWIYDEVSEEVTFADYGRAVGDRRLPPSNASCPPHPPFEGLLPD